MRWRSNGDVYFNPRSLGNDENLAHVYRQFHARGPLHRSAVGGWFVCGYELSRRLLLAPELRRDHPAVTNKHAMGHHESIENFEASLFGKEGPRDAVIRAVMRQMFSRSAVERHRSLAQARARELLGAIPADRSVDVVSDLALPFTLTVLSKLLGVDETSGAALREFTERTILLIDSYPAKAAAIAAADELTVQAVAVLNGILEDSPSQDTLAGVLRELARTNVIGPREAVANLGIAFAAGHDTTLSLVAQTLAFLSDHRAIGADALRTGGGMARLIEEAMRYFAPVQLASRVASCDMTVEGKTFEKGADVLILLGAANRDPAAFSDPDVFHLDRGEQPRSLGFGHGLHLCVGEQLARLHTEVLIETVLREFSGYRCTHDGQSWRSTASFRFPLDVRLDMSRNPEAVRP